MTSAASPRFSVVLNTYNRAHVVPRAIESVLGQTRTDFELVVVDDGSTDSTRDAVTAVSDHRIRYVHRPNGGLAAARNTGLQAARGDYVSFMDDDDLLKPWWLARLSEALEATGAAVVTCGTEIRTPGHEGAVIRLPEPLGPAFDDQVGLFLPGTFLVARDVLTAVGGYLDGLRCSEQTELGLRVVPHCTTTGRRITAVFEALVITNREVDAHRPLRRADYLHSGALLVLEHHHERLRRSPKMYADFTAIAAVQGARMGRYAQARRLMVQAIRANPREIRHFIRLLASLCPPLGRRLWGVWPPAGAPPART